MQITTYQSGETVDEIVGRVYVGIDTKTAAKAAATAIRAVNPALRRPASVEPGATIVVPDLPGAAHSEQTVPIATAGGAAVTAAVVANAHLVAGSLVDAAKEVAIESRLQRKALDAISFGDVGRRDEVLQVVKTLGDQADADAAEADALAIQVDVLTPQLAEDAATIQALLGG